MTASPDTLVTGGRLPLSLDEVDARWLTGALGHRYPGAVVASADRESERAGTSTSARFVLSWAETGGHDVPASVYVKGGFDPVMRRRVWSALIMEARFYAELADDVPLPIPRALFTGVDEEAQQGVVVLEDMAARGVDFGHITRPRGVDSVARLLESLGRLHARFWEDPRLETYADWGRPQRSFLDYLLREKHWDAVHERSYADRLHALLPDRATAVRGLHRCWELDDALPRTLLHGDPHSGNQFHEADGTPGFMDWQCTFPGAPGHDHAEMLITSLTTEERRTHEQELLRAYRDVLVAEGVDAPSYDALFLSYRQNQMHNMVQAVFNPYDMQTQEVTDLSATRSIAAAEDLDVLDSLGL